MAHLYDKAPPSFAKDPWAWDYTRDRIEQNTGLTYDKWQGKHFAGAAAMYKNVKKKYTASMESGALDIPRECVDCGQIHPHYVDDYVCKECRTLIEKADSYQAASETITRPAALDDIRQQLMEQLGHKTKKVGVAADPLTQQLMEQSAPGSTGKVSRNYRAMGAGKLATCLAELEGGSGDSYNRVMAKGESVEDHIEAALRAQQEQS